MARRWFGEPVWRRRLRVLAALTLAALAVALAGCGGSGQSGSDNPGPPAESADLLFVGEWRVYSEALFFDSGGGGGDSSVSTTRQLGLDADGTWSFGSSSGRWYVTSIDAEDWADWGVEAYGPDRKMVLEGWNDDVGSGPVEESGGGVDFFWVIYRVDEPGPGVVQMKFGRP